MRKLVFALAFGGVASLGAQRAVAASDDVVIIVNAANPLESLNAGDVSKMFLRKRTKWADGRLIQPIDQIETSPVRRRFSNDLLGMDVPSVKGFWQELVFSGRGEPPPERASDADVIAFVKANPTAIGYVLRSASAAAVKTITITK
jgi:ABC-type phosphate transport system substrate-binding protein